MTKFEFDTGWTRPDLQATTAGIEEGQGIRVANWKRAQNIFNKISANLQAAELVEDLDAYWRREELMVDALHLFDPAVSAELTEIYETQRAYLIHGGAERPHPAEPGNAQAPDTATAANTGELQDEF